MQNYIEYFSVEFGLIVIIAGVVIVYWNVDLVWVLYSRFELRRCKKKCWILPRIICTTWRHL